MKKDYKTIALAIIKAMGGEENIIDVIHCATRLRFAIKAKAAVDQEELKQIAGVAGIVANAQRFQVIIGTEVDAVFRELIKAGIPNGDQKEEVTEKTEKTNIFNTIIDTITGCMTPMIPALTAAGMMKLILTLLTTFELMSADSDTYRILDIIGDAAFYFMPMLLAVNASKKFQVNTSLAVIVAGVLLHPNFTAWVASGEKISFLHLPIQSVNYAASIIPVLLMVWIMSYIEKGVDKITPKVVKLLLNPSLVLLVSAPLALIVIGPLGSLAGNGLSAFIDVLSGTFGFGLVALLAAFMPFIVMTGMHHALTPIFLATFAATGQESLILISQICANLAQGGATWAVAVRSKNRKTKELATAAGLSAVMGITEPAIYGVTLKLKKPMIAAAIGAGIAGLYAGITHVSVYVMQNSIMAALAFVGEKGTANVINGAIMMILSIVVPFVLCFIFGFEESEE